MRGRAILTLVLAGTLAGCVSVAPSPDVPPATVAVVFDRVSARPVVVEGLADRATRRLVTAENPVRIASISKLIVALGVMRMVEADELDLDRDVSDYLGWSLRNPNQPEVPVTLRRLLSHRAGLRDAGDYVIPLGESLQTRLARPEAWASPDSQGSITFAYGNINSPVIASVMEAVSGERFDRLMTRLVFAPLELDACMNWSGCSDEAVERATVLYRDTGEVARDDLQGQRPDCIVVPAADESCNLLNYVPGTNGSLFSPQGGVRISAIDLVRIGQMIARGGDGFLTSASLAELVRPVGEDASGLPFFCRYGLAVQTIGGAGSGCKDELVGDSVPRIGHGGDAYGLRSGLWLDPASGCGFAYFVTGVPESDAPITETEQGGFASEERALIARVSDELRRCRE